MAVDNVDARGMPTQLITRRVPLRVDPRAVNDCVGVHTADLKIARNEQVRSSNLLPGSQRRYQRVRGQPCFDRAVNTEHSAR